jgi:hypothetical protein
MGEVAGIGIAIRSFDVRELQNLLLEPVCRRANVDLGGNPYEKLSVECYQRALRRESYRSVDRIRAAQEIPCRQVPGTFSQCGIERIPLLPAERLNAPREAKPLFLASRLARCEEEATTSTRTRLGDACPSARVNSS